MGTANGVGITARGATPNSEVALMKLPIPTIQFAVADANGIPLARMLSRSKIKSVARARQEAMFLVRELRSDQSLPQIARAFDRLDHTTVLHAVVETGKRAAVDPEVVKRLDLARMALLREVTAG